MQQPPFDEATVQREKEYVANKLRITVDELNGYLTAPKHTYRDYRSQKDIYRLGAQVMALIGAERGGKR